MNFLALFFFPSIALIFAPSFGTGLKCKLGKEDYVGNKTFVGDCPNPKDEYCLAFVCNQVGIVQFILWGCSETPEKDVCERDAKALTERVLKKTKIECQCQFGEKGKELDNEQFVLPPPPPIVPEVSPEELAKRLFCKQGFISDEGYGTHQISFCEEADEYCYAISCFMKDQFIDVWGCTANTDCSAFGTGCQCHFGERNVKQSNLNLMVPTFLRERSETGPAPPASTTSTTTASTTTSSTTTASTTTTTKAVPLTDNAGNEVTNGMTDSSSRATVNIYFEELPIPSGNGSRGNAGIFWPLLLALGRFVKLN
ncbi:hypothetical protein niasHS_008018 [Heterodera schachtii]|uniref:Uncharacterized protein n=1 Tax=Heterodera schachtii TaxID=97005 RepID=A0ABD2J2H5_HETSC